MSEGLSLDNFIYNSRSLGYWADYFTVNLPALPTTALEISNVIVRLNNRYQECFNIYNELMILCSSLSHDFEVVKRRAIGAKVAEMKEQGVSKLPGKDVLEAISLAECEEAHAIQQNLYIHQYTKEFFENIKNKLEKCMPLAKDILFSTGQSDRMFHRSGAPTQ